MKKIATMLCAMLLASSIALAAGPGPFYAKGDMYCAPGCWNADGGNLLSLAAGVWSGPVATDQGPGRHEFKIANLDWSENYFPWCNLWVHTSGPGDVVHFSLDTNVYGDGWLPNQDIVWSDHYAPPGTTFEVIGSAPETGGWAFGTPANLIGTVWTRVLTIATAGANEAKFRATGTWDVCNIGSEGAGAPCGANLAYTTVVDNTDVKFEFNSATGRARVTVLGPTPTLNTTWGKVKTLYR
ncbi:MAG: hypothetical protein HZC42_10665 [Candidatus Eisenbacteria bacterium]|nr:hypothetical protein [Candidatus Eisenbacteria bacterium]